MIYPQLLSTIRDLEDTFPLFCLRILYHLLCFIWRAPIILWIIPYIEYFALVSRHLQANRLTVTASWSSVCLDIHFFLPRKCIGNQDRALFGGGLRRLLLIAVSPLRIAALLQLLQTLTGVLIPKIKANKQLNNLHSRLYELFLLLLRSIDPGTQTGFQKPAAANKASQSFSNIKAALQESGQKSRNTLMQTKTSTRPPLKLILLYLLTRHPLHSQRSHLASEYDGQDLLSQNGVSQAQR